MPISSAPHRDTDPRHQDVPVRERLARIVPGIRAHVPAGRIAVVRLYGPISGGGRSSTVVELAAHLRGARRVPGVVLDIDSPGGSASASDDLYLAFERLARAKPLVAAIRGTGASGAYLAALPARRILANPNAIVGSIGVISAGPRLPRLLDRAGVTVSVRKAGRLKDMGAPWRDESDEERAKEQELIDAIYEAFVARVVAARRLPVERVRELATGEVWLGTRALALGLVDEIGDLERAVEVAAGFAGVAAKSSRVRLRQPLLGRLVDRVAGRAALAIADEIEARLGDRYRGM
ncbi:MAG TPA: signal peptide peptidase SppA [Candidatus Acidoferrales bacterium]|nr:signal peptide peptidase SppA [Candidatus Acidoferrales bacterium]